MNYFLQVHTTSDRLHQLPITSRNFESISRLTYLWRQSAQYTVTVPKPHFWTLFTSGTNLWIYESLGNPWHLKYKTLSIGSWISSKIKFLYLPKKEIKVDLIPLRSESSLFFLKLCIHKCNSAFRENDDKFVHVFISLVQSWWLKSRKLLLILTRATFLYKKCHSFKSCFYSTDSIVFKIEKSEFYRQSNL